ncbi:MAG: glycosyltransferase family 2 protein [Phycisphaeraceae bacterium]|nr:glycosyltransferase family 2 protein [Phycisphaeraceae bacterium]
MPMLSIVIPIYNERQLLPQVIERVRHAPLPDGVERQIILVDDGSTDGTIDVLRKLATEFDDLKVCFQPANRGKGAALRRGFKEATGDIVMVQDADLEYDPNDYPKLLQPLLDDLADVVYGTRFLGGTHRVLYYWHSVGNRILTTLSNMFTNLNLTDMECCYKLFKRQVLEQLVIEENRFGFEPEITAKIARLQVRLYETPITYRGRTYAEGKKITWHDGVSALRCILRYNLGRHRTPGGNE